MRSRLLLAVVVVLAVLAALVLVSRFAGPARGAVNRALHMPAIAAAAFVEPLSGNAAAALEQRKRLIGAWRSRSSYGLHRVQGSVEGTPIGLFLIAHDGTLTLVTDYSHDSYSTRAVVVQNPVALELGPEAHVEQHPLRAWFPETGEAYVRCQLSSGQVAFF